MRNEYYTKILNWVLPIVVVIIILTGGLIEGLVVMTAYVIYRFYSERDKFFSYIGKRKYLSGKLKKAIIYYEKAYRTGRAEAKVIISYVYAMILNGDFNKAREILAESKKRHDASTVEMQTVICEALLQWKEDGKLKGAMSDLGRLDETMRASSYYGVMGKMMIESNDSAKAREYNEEAYKYNSKHAVILENLLRIYCIEEEYERALKVAKILIKRKPETLDAFYYCALAFEKSGKSRKAAGLYRKAMSYEETILSSVSRKDINY